MATIETTTSAALFGKDGVLVLMKQYGKPATAPQLYDFMIANYAKQRCMTKAMIMHNLRKLEKWRQVKRLGRKDKFQLSEPVVWQLLPNGNTL